MLFLVNASLICDQLNVNTRVHFKKGSQRIFSEDIQLAINTKLKRLCGSA